MKRGDIFFANLDPAIGGETQKCRPVLIVSNDANNRVANTITIVPLTSNTSKVYPFEVLLEKEFTGLQKHSKAQCHQIRTISKNRITAQKGGTVSVEILHKINRALKLHLDLF